MPNDTPIILVPTDFGPSARAALSVALELAPRLSAKIVLLHVSAPPEPLDPTLPTRVREEVRAAERHEIRARLDELRREARGSEALLREGEPAARILSIIGELEPALVVMGRHERGTLARWFMGSVTERVIRDSPVPVLTVQPPGKAREEAA